MCRARPRNSLDRCGLHGRPLRVTELCHSSPGLTPRPPGPGLPGTGQRHGGKGPDTRCMAATPVALLHACGRRWRLRNLRMRPHTAAVALTPPQSTAPAGHCCLPLLMSLFVRRPVYSGWEKRARGPKGCVVTTAVVRWGGCAVRGGGWVMFRGRASGDTGRRPRQAGFKRYSWGAVQQLSGGGF